MANVRVTINRKALRDLMRGPEIQADLVRRANKIAKRADAAANAPGGHGVDTQVGANRARASVRTVTPKAMYKEATQQSLTKSIDAGRR
jgi:hypothetical protein